MVSLPLLQPLLLLSLVLLVRMLGQLNLVLAHQLNLSDASGDVTIEACSYSLEVQWRWNF